MTKQKHTVCSQGSHDAPLSLVASIDRWLTSSSCSTLYARVTFLTLASRAGYTTWAERQLPSACASIDELTA